MPDAFSLGEAAWPSLWVVAASFVAVVWAGFALGRKQNRD